MSSICETLARIQSCELASVTFVRDYFQLAFESGEYHHFMSIMSPSSVSGDFGSFDFQDDSFPGVLRNLIDSKVIEVRCREGDSLHLRFDCGIELRIGLDPTESACGEAIILHSSDRQGNRTWDVVN